ncbi:MAG: Gfo/Idh/MocA family protein [Candidatus Hodarchaeota archaeon]
MEKLRVGLIGAGGFGFIHLDGYSKNNNCQLVAVSSRTYEHAKLASEKYEIPSIYVGDEWKKMLRKENLDIVSICTPNYLHYPMTIEAIENNINILCEKPICISKDELKSVEKKLEGKNLIYFTSFQKRYIPFIPMIKEIINNEILGNIILVRYYFSHYGPYKSWEAMSEERWFFDSEKAGGGVLLDLGVHCIDILRYLVGEFTKIDGANFNTSCINMKNEDNCNVLFRFQNGSLGIISVSWCNEPLELIEIYGTKGYFHLNLHSKTPFIFSPKILKKNVYIKKILSRKVSDNNFQYLLIDHFINCVLEKKQGNPDFLDGKRSVEFVLDAYSFKNIS